MQNSLFDQIYPRLSSDAQPSFNLLITRTMQTRPVAELRIFGGRDQKTFEAWCDAKNTKISVKKTQINKWCIIKVLLPAPLQRRNQVALTPLTATETPGIGHHPRLSNCLFTWQKASWTSNSRGTNREQMHKPSHMDKISGGCNMKFGDMCSYV